LLQLLWFSSLFILLRLIGCRQFDAALFSILAATSAAAIFWFVIPETYSFGSLSILLALGLTALAQHQKAVVLVVCGRQRPDIVGLLTGWWESSQLLVTLRSSPDYA